jgi:hypothetical protein
MAFERYIPWPRKMEQLGDKLDEIIVDLELFLGEAPEAKTETEEPSE